MKRFFTLAFGLVTLGCASTAREPAPAPATVQVQTAVSGLEMYEGTYELEGISRTIELRVWVGDDGKLHGELVGMGQQTTFRPGGEHRFLHGNADDIWVVFNVENGRAIGATMHQRGREISGMRGS